MHIIQVDTITVNFAGREIFADLSWAIDNRARVGLVGPNGAGKSSLLKVITGEVVPDSGYVRRFGEVSVGYLAQVVELPPADTLWQAASSPPPRLAAVSKELARIEASFADPEVYGDERKLSRALEAQEAALAQFERLGGPRHESLVTGLLAHFGFGEEDMNLPVSGLSGGQKKLVALVRLAVETPEVLLLDEPDNHLDVASKQRLEAFIRTYAGAVVIVSHDRYLLDDVATHIAELDGGKLTLYVGNYSAYTTARELARLRQQQAYVAQQKEIARIEAAIARFELWASMVEDERHMKQARSRRKMLDRMEERGEIIEKVMNKRPIGIELDGWRGSEQVLELKQVTLGFDDKLLFNDINLLVRHGERVGLVGPNGAGKSVLFRTIRAELEPLAGEVKIGPSVAVGYYSQEHQTLSQWMERTPIDMLRDLAPMAEDTAVTRLLKFQFSYDQTRQKINTLSGGEMSRLQLLRVMLARPNLLLFDEPTNNLDIASIEALEAALEDFEGALLVISHDRYFLDKMVDRVVAIEGGELANYTGGYTDYLAADEE